VGWAGALGWGIPAAIWAVLAVLGRPRQRVALGSALLVGGGYALAALYAGWTRNSDWLTRLSGEGILVGVLLGPIVTAGVSAFSASRNE
jgi:hypothetical protein